MPEAPARPGVTPLPSFEVAPDIMGGDGTSEIISRTYDKGERPSFTREPLDVDAPSEAVPSLEVDAPETDPEAEAAEGADEPEGDVETDEDESDLEGGEEEEADEEGTDEPEAEKPFNPADPDTYADPNDAAVAKAALARINRHEERVSKRATLLDRLEKLTGGDLDTFEATLEQLEAEPQSFQSSGAQPNAAPVEVPQTPEAIAAQLFENDPTLQKIEERRARIEAKKAELRESGYTESDEEYSNQDDKLFTLDIQAQQRQEIVWGYYQNHLAQQETARAQAAQQEQDRLAALDTELTRLKDDPRYKDYLEAHPGAHQSIVNYAKKNGLSAEKVLRDEAFDWMIERNAQHARQARETGRKEGRTGREKGSQASLLKGRGGKAANVTDDVPADIAEDYYATLAYQQKRGKFKLVQNE